MNEPSPYSLQTTPGRSDEYYHAAAVFADTWLAKTRDALRRPLKSFLDWHTDPDPSDEEAGFEMLVLGVLLREHGADALNMAPVPAWVLARLVEAQDRLPITAVEKPVKAMRGLIHGLAQAADENCAAEQAVDELPFDAGASALVGRLVDWLAAAGLGAQALHMRRWRDYLAQLREQDAQAILACCLLLADEFAEESEAAFGAYTSGVDRFVESLEEGPDLPFAQGCRSRWRYDAGLVTRSRVEYHLGMLGTEVLNRAYRARYLAAPRKIVIVPDCLCAHSRRVETADSARCETELTSLGYRCARCTPNCRVHQVSLLGEKHGFEAYILPDDLRGIGLGSCSKLSGAGVVGVSCALTNWDAGWMVNDALVPAQGVLLDYAGCRSHWAEKGQTTNLNLHRLIEVVGKETRD
jgi:uncharacterized protein